MPTNPLTPEREAEQWLLGQPAWNDTTRIVRDLLTELRRLRTENELLRLEMHPHV